MFTALATVLVWLIHLGFDTEFMRQLYTVGYDMAAKGYPWQKTPPGFAATAGADK